MAARDIFNESELEAWLRGRSAEDARVIAARLALRAAPTLQEAGRQLGDADWPRGIILIAFLSYAVAWVNVKLSARSTDLAAAAATRIAAAHGTAAAAFRTPDFFTSLFEWPFNRYNVLLPSSSTSYSAASVVSLMVGHATSDLFNRPGYNRRRDAAAATREIWDEVRKDAEALESGTAPAQLASTQLWGRSNPLWPHLRFWNDLKSELVARSIEHWDVWTDWYEARLHGEPGNEEEEIARILEVTEDEWAAGPAVANKKIKDIIARFRANPASATAPPETSPKEARAPLFISHATAADGAAANALVATLEAAGQPCWIAPRDIPAGADWNGSILAAIEACAGVVLLMSEASVASRFVQAEIQHAFEHGKRIAPALLDPSAQPAMIDLRLKTIQHIPPSKDSGLSARAILAALP
jgi:hypothetical protein